jgi:alkanesulfonate monooxygenase SsuD/methylene tetrahydromethanopterin reductase-like flavin-dependent oxidoreductase (luciferase family)
MKFGIIVSRKMIDRGSSEPYGKLFRYAEEMEDLGYDLAWLGHHRYSDKTAFGGDTASEPSAPLTMLTALAARTRRMELCTNIMLLPAYHPLDVAQEINSLNEIANNRLRLGVGIGYKPDEFENTGWGFKNRISRFEECIDVLRLALPGSKFSYSGKHFNISEVAIQPPALPGEPMPIWVGAVSEPGMIRAARVGDGWIIGFSEHLIELQGKIARYKALAEEHGRGSTICLMRDLHIAPTRAGIDPNWLPNVVKVWQSYADLGATPDRDEAASEVVFGGKSVTLEEFVPNRAIVGTPEDCIPELQRIQEMANPEYLFLTPTGVPDMEQHVQELRLFAKEVMPLFRS